MKSIWIKRGIPMIVVIMGIAVGVMSCATDPLSTNNDYKESVGDESQIYMSPSGSEIPNESSTMEAPVRTSVFGTLKKDPVGHCWYLLEKPKIGYELLLMGDFLKEDDEGRKVIIYGFESWQTKPECSDYFSVFKVYAVKFK